MSNATIESGIELGAIRVGIDLTSKSTNAQDLCRRVALSAFMDGFCHGVAVYLLDQRPVLVEVASFGRSHDFGPNEISAWDDTVLSKAVRSRKVVTEVNCFCITKLN